MLGPAVCVENVVFCGEKITNYKGNIVRNHKEPKFLPFGTTIDFYW